jgi:hypothetical protein
MMEIEPSNASQCHTSSPIQQQNPYARRPSRRPIACVTCAKAKTKCNKAASLRWAHAEEQMLTTMQLPACFRCISKGIKCEPRSTRRTSENNYRANVGKSFLPPKRHFASTSSRWRRHTSPQSIPSSCRQEGMRAASLIDYRSAMKADQENPGLSGYPMLTPLPTYTSQILDECYSYSSSPEQDLSRFTRAMEMSTFPNLGRLSPQTPDPIVCHEPVSMLDNFDHYTTSQPWSDEALTSCEVGFDPNMAGMLPLDIWPTPDTTDLMSMAQLSWPQSVLSASSQQMSTGLILRNDAVPSMTTSEYSVDNYSSDAMSGDWKIYQPTTTHMDLANTITLAPYIHDVNSIPTHAPIWGDVCVPGPSPY